VDTHYFVNASRGMDFQFSEPKTFEQLESVVERLVTLGYEINTISLIEGNPEGFVEVEKQITTMQNFWKQHTQPKKLSIWNLIANKLGL
jgi:hypothetical protein